MSTATHPFTPEEIMAFVDGELDRSASALITNHLELCQECREEFLALEKILRASR